ncbi:MAG: hypothetical protein FRX48_04662 [Lasallia pustulata]|uniref:Uncharacterized protein n=1 Tax=Lasallia pustulata TaxID=136370 RepID=A0A5M8PQR7_9LECA|nr:MAG: hypothetical protein FRX48_04662 [Lasallia pustulata]
MPKVISYTPSWLSRPSPGFRLFSSSQDVSRSPRANGKPSALAVSSHKSEGDYLGPQRTIARRGTEIFVVVGNQIRWSDLCMLKDDWEEAQALRKSNSRSKRVNYSNGSHEEGHAERSYRMLKVPVSEQIRQIIPSPNGQLLVIVTSYTVHIAILPDSSHLGQPDTTPIRLKTHMLGPTTHVLSQPAVASVLWHPLGVGANCLVTINAEAVVRVWEISRESRGSFESPTLTIDLRKLVHGTSQEDDFGAFGLGRSKGFSADAIEMEVASACFGGNGMAEEHGWASMTLWVAMKEGDVYALCPLLPNKWHPPPTLVPSLSTAIVSKLAAQREDDAVTAEEKCHNDQQYHWISEIDSQEPTFAANDSEFGDEVEIFHRPAHPGPIPRLQGPFEILPDDSEEYLEISDIHVVAAKVDLDELMLGEDDESDLDLTDQDELSAAMICLSTTNGRVYVCLDLEGVEGQWLPTKRSDALEFPDSTPQPSLTLLEALDTLCPESTLRGEWPTFSADVHSRYSFFLTNNTGVFFFSLASWVQGLEGELQSSNGAGSAIRLDVLTQGPGTLRERVLPIEHRDEDGPRAAVTACVVLQDSDLGYFLLTAVGEQPQAATLDSPYDQLNGIAYPFPHRDFEPEMKLLALGPSRAAYQPPMSLFEDLSFGSTFLDKHQDSRHKWTRTQEIRLSGATLQLMTEAHRVLSEQTQRLGAAAADLFRRCERMQDEFREQIRRADEVATRIDNLADADGDDYGEAEPKEHELTANYFIEKRLERAKAKQGELVARHEALRRKLARSGGRELSEKEEGWIAEIDKVEHSVLGEETEDGDEQPRRELWQRYKEARDLANALVEQAKAVAESGQPETNGSFKVPPDLRKAKVAQVMGLLERESALVEAAQSRLERLNLFTAS